MILSSHSQLVGLVVQHELAHIDLISKVSVSMIVLLFFSPPGSKEPQTSIVRQRACFTSPSPSPCFGVGAMMDPRKSCGGGSSSGGSTREGSIASFGSSASLSSMADSDSPPSETGPEPILQPPMATSVTSAQAAMDFFHGPDVTVEELFPGLSGAQLVAAILDMFRAGQRITLRFFGSNGQRLIYRHPYNQRGQAQVDNQLLQSVLSRGTR